MAKLTGPLFSTDARGTICGTLTYNIKRDTNYVAHSLTQPERARLFFQDSKAYFNEGIQSWKILDPHQKYLWSQFAITYYPNRSGYNCFISEWLNCCRAGIFPSLEPPT